MTPRVNINTLWYSHAVTPWVEQTDFLTPLPPGLSTAIASSGHDSELKGSMQQQG